VTIDLLEKTIVIARQSLWSGVYSLGRYKTDIGGIHIMLMNNLADIYLSGSILRVGSLHHFLYIFYQCLNEGGGCVD
jgi:hypothetical protein